MKLIIAGGRDYRLSKTDWVKLSTIDNVSQVVSGACRGVDSDGESWAIANGITIKQFPANWPVHGKAAGPMRNKQMAVYADAVALFPGGRGTQNMYDNATKHNLKIFDFR